LRSQKCHEVIYIGGRHDKPGVPCPRPSSYPEALSRRLSSEAATRGIDPELLVLELLANALCEDERSKAEAYWSAAEHFLARAGEELSKGDLR